MRLASGSRAEINFLAAVLYSIASGVITKTELISIMKGEGNLDINSFSRTRSNRLFQVSKGDIARGVAMTKKVTQKNRAKTSAFLQENYKILNILEVKKLVREMILRKI